MLSKNIRCAAVHVASPTLAHMQIGYRYQSSNKNSHDFTCPETRQPFQMDAELYPSTHLNKPTSLAEYYPKVEEDKRQDLDGMDFPISSKALWEMGLPKGANETGESLQGNIRQPHPVWTEAECDSIQITHKTPTFLYERLAWFVVWWLRRAFDLLTGYSLGFKSGDCMIRRITILETVAGIPGMVGAAIRHFRSLRTGARDYGWIHSLLEEAENERMHLMIAMSVHDPNWIVRMVIKIGQMLILPLYTMAYIISPKTCHAWVGYIEEEAVKTYTQILDLIDQGHLDCFKTQAPPAAKKYYHLPDGVTMRDIIANIRADEAHHRELNHCLSTLTKRDVNPFSPGF